MRQLQGPCRLAGTRVRGQATFSKPTRKGGSNGLVDFCGAGIGARAHGYRRARATSRLSGRSGRSRRCRRGPRSTLGRRSQRTTKLYDRTNDQITLDEIERIATYNSQRAAYLLLRKNRDWEALRSPDRFSGRSPTQTGGFTSGSAPGNYVVHVDPCNFNRATRNPCYARLDGILADFPNSDDNGVPTPNHDDDADGDDNDDLVEGDGEPLAIKRRRVELSTRVSTRRPISAELVRTPMNHASRVSPVWARSWLEIPCRP